MVEFRGFPVFSFPNCVLPERMCIFTRRKFDPVGCFVFVEQVAQFDRICSEASMIECTCQRRESDSRTCFVVMVPEAREVWETNLTEVDNIHVGVVIGKEVCQIVC